MGFLNDISGIFGSHQKTKRGRFEWKLVNRKTSVFYDIALKAQEENKHREQKTKTKQETREERRGGEEEEALREKGYIVCVCENASCALM